MKRFFIAGIMSLLSFISVFSQTNIEGKILDKETNDPLTGATIIVPETRVAAISDNQGRFALTVPEGYNELRVSFVGYETQKFPISDTTTWLNIKMAPREHNIEKVVIQGESDNAVDRIFHQSKLSFQGLESEGSASNTSVFNKLMQVPGVYVESQDLAGLSEKTVRIRGIKSYFSGMTVEGIPNYGIMPIGPRDYLYDMENIGSVSVYKGVIPSGVFSATGNKGGVVRLNFKRPAEQFGITAKQSFGSDTYTRSFLRIDAGRLPTNTKLFGSYSYTQSEKWKGAGNIGPRHNLTLGITQSLGAKLHAEIFFIHNQLERHDFRELSYDQAQNISDSYNLHFLRDITGDAADKAYYYDNNRGNFVNSALYTNLQYTPSDRLAFSLKPYLSAEDAKSWHKQITGPPQNPNYMLFNRIRNTEKAGVLVKGTGSIDNINISAGYWMELNDLSAKVHVYKLLTDAERMDLGINPKTENITPGTIHNPYLKISGSSGKLNWHAGLKYFYYSEANTKNYSIKANTRERVPSLDLRNTEYGAWLPAFGVGYSITDQFQVSLAYGKNYMRPYMYGPMRSLYLRNESNFLDNGLSYQDLLENWEMETSDQFTVKVGWDENNFHFEVNPFYTLHHNVLTPVFDSQVGVQYYRNVGEVKSHGIDFQGDVDITDNFSAFLSTTWMEMAYDRNPEVGTNQVLDIKGNQTPSVPVFSGLGGITYAFNGFAVSTRLKHIGKRYGDATNQEKLPSYNLINLKGSYNIDFSWTDRLELALEMKNLLNARYVGRIDVMDFQNSGNASYYAGMPRSFVVTLSTRF